MNFKVFEKAINQHPKALVSIIFGLSMCSLGLYYGYSETLHAIRYGLETRQWPYTKIEHSSPGTTSYPSYSINPDSRSSWGSYYFKIDEVWYHNDDYDVNGGEFWGNDTQLFVKRGHYGPGKMVYYNPDNPSEAVLIPGISFSLKTRFYIIVLIVGLLICVPGIYLIKKKYRQLVYDEDYDYDKECLNHS